MAQRSSLFLKRLTPLAVVVATLGLAASASASGPAPQPGQLLRSWTAAVAHRGLPVPSVTYDLVSGNWRGMPGRSWTDVAERRIYLSPEIERDARDASFPQGRREMRLQLLHEVGHALDPELTDADRGRYAAIMDDHRAWFAHDGDHVDVENPPSERFAVAYSAVAAGLSYNRLRPDYGFQPTTTQYRQLIRYFHDLADVRADHDPSIASAQSSDGR